MINNIYFAFNDHHLRLWQNAMGLLQYIYYWYISPFPGAGIDWKDG